jgi:hypothetical protein
MELTQIPDIAARYPASNFFGKFQLHDAILVMQKYQRSTQDGA